MRPVNAYASMPHYLDHLAPIWRALDETERGRLFCGGTAALAHARSLGLDPAPTVTQAYPLGRRTLIAGHQPDVLVASLRDYRATSRARCVWVEHGAGQLYLDDDIPADNTTGPGKGRVRLFLLPGPAIGAAVSAAYPRTDVAVIGCPKLDQWADGARPRPNDASVLFTFHWTPSRSAPERRSALPHWEAAIPSTIAQLRRRGVRVLGHAHPRAWTVLGPLWDELGVVGVRSWDTALAVSDVVVADNTSALYEAAAADRPVVVLNAPWYRRHVEHGLRFWDCADVGIQADTGTWSELAAAVDATLRHDPRRARRTEVTAQVYGPQDGAATTRAVEAMRASLP